MFRRALQTLLREFFGYRCSFCRESFYTNTHSALCTSCVAELGLSTPSLHSQVVEKLPVYSVAPYEDWFRAFILANKRGASDSAINWCAELLHRALSQLGYGPEKVQLFWVPSSEYGSFHLSEAVVHSLQKYGYQVVHKTLFLQTVASARKLHFAESLDERKKMVHGKFSRIHTFEISETRAVVFIDDVCTTGATLLALRSAMQQNPLFQSNPRFFGLTLAFTPRRDST